jgi:S-adenosylmethionine hydrolase
MAGSDLDRSHPPVVSLLTDYGLRDEFVGVCRGVILGICPEARIVDVTHGIARHAVRAGAVVLRNVIGYLPVGVHVAVVDPQVGTERRSVALRCDDGRLLVGPDNGVLSLAWERCGGVVEAIDVSRSPHRLEPVSATFHGRDVFSPVAAHLAAGAELAEAGRAIDAEELTTIELEPPRVSDGELEAPVLAVDGFGNFTLDASHRDLTAAGLRLGHPVEVEAAGERYLATLVETFADVGPGEILVYEDPYRSLAVAVNRGDAAATMRVGEDARVILRRR